LITVSFHAKGKGSVDQPDDQRVALVEDRTLGRVVGGDAVPALAGGHQWASPANATAERWIGNVRRKCIDRFMIYGTTARVDVDRSEFG
jgi:hypothetical protein